MCKTNAKDIVVIHLNNSKKERGSCADVHDFILNKDGKIPINDLSSFMKIIFSMKTVPIIILETPSNDVKNEIEWLKKII